MDRLQLYSSPNTKATYFCAFSALPTPAPAPAAWRKKGRISSECESSGFCCSARVPGLWLPEEINEHSPFEPEFLSVATLHVVHYSERVTENEMMTRMKFQVIHKVTWKYVAKICVTSVASLSLLNSAQH